MEKQHLKRLGYGFSALVMALSAVNFYPGYNNSASAASTDAACANVDAVTTAEAVVNIDPSATSCALTFATKGSAKLESIDTMTMTKLNGKYLAEANADNTAATFTISKSGLDYIKEQVGGTLNVSVTVIGEDNLGATQSKTYTVTLNLVALDLTVASDKNELYPGQTATLTKSIGANYTGDADAVEYSYVASNSALSVDFETDTITFADGDYAADVDGVTLKITATNKTTGEVSDTKTITIDLKHFAEMEITDKDTDIDLNKDADPANATAGFTVTEPTGTKVTVTTDLVEASQYDNGAHTYVYNSDDNDAPGVYTVTVTQKAADATLNKTIKEETFEVRIGDTTEITDYINASEWADEEGPYPALVLSENSTPFYTHVAENSTPAVATAAVETIKINEVEFYYLGLSNLTVGTTSIKLYHAEDDPLLSKTYNAVVYDVAEETSVKVGEDIDLSTIIGVPTGYDYEVTSDDGAVATAGATKLTGVAKGSANLTVKFTKGGADVKDARGNDVTASVKVEVYDEEDVDELGDTYVEYGSDSVIAAIGYKPVSDKSEVSYEFSDESAFTITTDDNGVATGIKANTPGNFTVTVMETLAGDVINTQENKNVYVYGIDLPKEIFMIEGETRTDEVLMNLITLDEYSTGTSAISFSIENGEYTVTAAEGSAGTRAIQYVYTKVTGVDVDGNDVTEEDGGTILIHVYAPMVVDTLDDEIDLASEEEDAAAFAVTTADDGSTIVVEEAVEDGEEKIFNIEAADPITEEGLTSYAYTVTLLDAENTKTGEYQIKISHETADGDEIEYDFVTIKVVDSEEEPVVDEYALDIESPEADENGAIEVYAGVSIHFIGTVKGTLMMEVDGEEAQDMSDFVDEEGNIEISLYSSVAETYNVVFYVAEDETKTASFAVNVKDVEEEEAFDYTITSDAGDTLTSILDAMKNAYESGDYETLAELEEVLVASMGGNEEAAARVVAAAFNGQEISTVVTQEAYDPDDEVKEAILVKMDSDFTDNVTYYDVNIFVQVNGETVGVLSNLTNEQTIVVDMGTPEDGYTRTFQVIRYHYNAETGEYEIDEITDWEYDEETGLLSFASDKFSTFAIGYKDTVKAATADTGEFTGEGASAAATSMAAVISTIAAITLAGAAAFAKRK